jgi:AraC family transcriptional regulator, dual regulator of chb operon
MATPLRFADVCPNGEQLHIRETRLRGHYRTFAHTHDFWEFFHVTSGAVRLHVNGATVAMETGTLCLAEPADEHCFQNATGADDATFMNVAVPADIVRQAISACAVAPRRASPTVPLILRAPPPEFTALLDRAERLLNGAGSTDAACQRMLALSLCTALFAEIAIASRDTLLDQSVPPWLRRAMREMELRENYLAGLPRLLELCGRSQEHVTRTIRRCRGVSPTEFINQLRLCEAARLLRDTDNKVLPVALQAGFGNMSHFLALFRRRYGSSPREYRRQQRLVVDPVTGLS